MSSSTDMQKVKALRDATGLPFGEVKKALDAADGDEAKAAELLKALGARVAAKKSDRSVHEGIVESYIHTNRKTGALVEVLCETDFVARNPEFQQLAKDIAMQIAAMKPANTAELLAQSFVKNPEQTVQDLIHQTIAKVGENIQLGTFALFEI